MRRTALLVLAGLLLAGCTASPNPNHAHPSAYWPGKPPVAKHVSKHGISRKWAK